MAGIEVAIGIEGTDKVASQTIASCTRCVHLVVCSFRKATYGGMTRPVFHDKICRHYLSTKILEEKT